MYKRVTHLTAKFNLLLKFAVITLAAISASVASGADQGKLGKSSSGSVEISVFVNQTLSSVSPNELLFNKVLETKSTQPFCIAHHGFNKNANVPYELIVTDFHVANNRENKYPMPFNVYLENKNVRNSKRQLTQGVSISTQSNLRIEKDMQNACANSGLQLSIEENNHEQNTSDTDSVGVMVLLISPT